MDTTIRNVQKKCGVFPPSKYQGKDASFVKLSSTIEVAIPLTMGKKYEKQRAVSCPP